VPASDFSSMLRSTFAWAPAWAVGVVLIAGALAAALAVHGLIVRAMRRGLSRRGRFAQTLLVRTRAPSRFALMVGALSWAVHVAPVDPGWERGLQHILLIAIITLFGWAVLTAVNIGTALYVRRLGVEVNDNLHARKLLTQTRILRRAVSALVIIVTAGLALMTIPGVKQFGVSLLAAGGAAGIIVGLALQPVLSNLLAGVQIAFTQPIRIDDAVVVQNQFGHVEEINSTYVVIRLRDLRRMIVPLKHFLDQPFENWTRESSELVTEVLFLVDQRVPMDRLRAKVDEIVRASPLWAGDILKLQLNDIREKSMEVRCLASARNAAEAADLRAEVREKMITWLQQDYPALVPRNGVELDTPTPPSTAGARPGDQRVQ